mmetsp:Transcript_49857/g.124999  ORF Transcript_49857/g.124999 Transcript_49857/m.124999 type:complete len:320 (+) Transcript_49857:423-1382(+)
MCTHTHSRSKAIDWLDRQTPPSAASHSSSLGSTAAAASPAPTTPRTDSLHKVDNALLVGSVDIRPPLAKVGVLGEGGIGGREHHLLAQDGRVLDNHLGLDGLAGVLELHRQLARRQGAGLPRRRAGGLAAVAPHLAQDGPEPLELLVVDVLEDLEVLVLGEGVGQLEAGEHRKVSLDGLAVHDLEALDVLLHLGVVLVLLGGGFHVALADLVAVEDGQLGVLELLLHALHHQHALELLAVQLLVKPLGHQLAVDALRHLRQVGEDHIHVLGQVQQDVDQLLALQGAPPRPSLRREVEDQTHSCCQTCILRDGLPRPRGR